MASVATNGGIKHAIYSSQRTGGVVAKCGKFVPQAFNTNKCQQCFNLKEAHSAEALAEFSKVNLKIVYI
jgi:hypothetical protein